LALLATSAQAEASYEAAGQAFAVLIFWALIAVVILLVAVGSCIHKKSAIPLVAPLAFVVSVAVLTQLAVSSAPFLPDSQATLWGAALAIPLIAIAIAWFSVVKLMRESRASGRS
jgi:hypothetical protein